MDLAAVAVVVLVVAVLAIKVRTDRAHRASPSQRYQNVFTLAAFGLFLLGAGVAGWEVRRAQQDVPWSDTPVWWEVGVGLALLTVAAVLARPLLKRPA